MPTSNQTAPLGDYVNRLRREYGVHVNAWNSHPRLITSMDYLKRLEPLAGFLASQQRKEGSPLRDWDLLIVDEAHNVAPQGRGNYPRPTDRTAMMREILPSFEHRLFLTATPHNGFTESFTALLEMLDPLRFSRGPITARRSFEEHRDAIMIRRVKEEIVDDFGRQRFPQRIVDPAFEVELNPLERSLVELLDTYTRSLIRHSAAKGRTMAVLFALTLLKKRLLSSPLAFSRSIQVHRAHLQVPGEEESEESRREELEDARRRLEEELDDDEEKARLEEQAMQQASTFFEVTDEELRLVEDMVELASALEERPDTKFNVLADIVRRELRGDGAWNDERLVIFTEYRDTLEYLDRELAKLGWGDRVMHLTGGMGSKDREAIKTAFRRPPGEHPVRILLATDAASEGLNLQDHCRWLIHYEIPWNPNKLEQRNGRIDRKGQEAKEVHCRHFSYSNNEDQRFLDVIIDKVKTQRDDLGAVGDVVARQVTDCMLRQADSVQLREDFRRALREDLGSEVRTAQQIRQRTQGPAARRQTGPAGRYRCPGTGSGQEGSRRRALEGHALGAPGAAASRNGPSAGTDHQRTAMAAAVLSPASFHRLDRVGRRSALPGTVRPGRLPHFAERGPAASSRRRQVVGRTLLPLPGAPEGRGRPVGQAGPPGLGDPAAGNRPRRPSIARTSVGRDRRRGSLRDAAGGHDAAALLALRRRAGALAPRSTALPPRLWSDLLVAGTAVAPRDPGQRQRRLGAFAGRLPAGA